MNRSYPIFAIYVGSHSTQIKVLFADMNRTNAIFATYVGSHYTEYFSLF
jgi:hypothetical protein